MAPTLRRSVVSVLWTALTLGVAMPAAAQFTMVPTPAASAAPSSATSVADYKREAAHHVYAAYASRIYKGKLRPLLHGIMITETHIDAQGHVTGVAVIRKPAAAEVGPWVTQLIQRASPFPAPSRLGATRVVEIWLVDKSGQFQLDTLTEGQL